MLKLGMNTKQFVNRAGQAFGSWKILEYAGSNGIGRRWLCRCKCGTERPVQWASLQSGVSRSCGCEKTIFVKSHGMSKTRLYGMWKSMKDRCENPNCDAYPNYGGRGITVCPEWRNSYEQFYMDMGDRPGRGYSLERVNNNLGYSKSNVIWGTTEEQGRNKRTTRFLTFRGETKSMVEWASVLGINYPTLRSRLNSYGMSVEDAFTLPTGSIPVKEGSISKKVFVEHAGETHNHWTILSYSHFTPNNGRIWNCRCACGAEKQVPYSQLKNGKSQSCGCMRNHGLSKTRLYSVWVGMIDRCENPECKQYAKCGGSGIKVCAEWRDSFETMLRDMGDRPSENHMLCRIDTKKDYEKDNCTWMTPQEQSRAHHSTLIEFRGEKKTYKEWGDIMGLPASTIEGRLRAYGWSVEDALTKPKNYRPTSSKNNPAVKV